MTRFQITIIVTIALSALGILALLTSCESASSGRMAAPGQGFMSDSRAATLTPQAFPPGALPSLDEEVWVIVRSDDATTTDAETPGSGALVGHLDDDPERTVPLPLRHTEVQGSLAAYLASVEVTQHFHNPYDGTIEAVYVFPLPQNAAINQFVMTIGDRRIRGIIERAEKARETYEAAKRQGYAASLLEQNRPNIFTQSVANIAPGASIDISITYFHTLAYDDGWYEFVFPMVVGPRFNPPDTTDGIGAVAYGSNRPGRQPTNVSYLVPGTRSGHDIALTVDIDAGGIPIEEIRSVNHRITEETVSLDRSRVAIASDDTIPNKDFVLRYRVAGDTVRAAAFTHRDAQGDGYFTLMVYPPRELRDVPRAPIEMVFVIDCSGSMSGEPIRQAKAAIVHALNGLRPEDTFQIIRFSNSASALGAAPLAATRDNIRRAIRHVESLNGSGGTMMVEGLKAALNFPSDGERPRYVTFLTDGYIGNERDILRAVHEHVGAARVFSFGVGSAPNRYLMNRMAKIGRGAVAYLALHDDARSVMDAYQSRISHPALGDVRVDWGDLRASDVYPSDTPDLFVGRPIILTGRFAGTGRHTVTVRGTVAGRTVAMPVTIDTEDALARHDALPAIWARTHIAELVDRSAWDDAPDLVGEITRLALRHNLMSPFTSFVAVDPRTRTTDGHGTTVPVGVPVPDGVRYETAVGGE